MPIATHTTVHFNRDGRVYPAPAVGVGVVVDPSASAGGFPDETNTGWEPTGVTLTVVNEDPFYVTTPGAVIDSLDIRGMVFVMAANVTIKRCKITSGNQPMVKTYEPDGSGGLNDLAVGLLIEDTEFDGMSNEDSTGIGGNGYYTLRRCNLHHIGSGARLGNEVVVEDNYVHDIVSTLTSHNGGFPVDAGVDVTIRHNTILMDSGNGYVIASYNGIPDGNVVSDVLIENNFLAGGNYIVYGGSPGNVTPNLRVLNNKFSRMFFANGGFFGPAANCSDVAEWSGNVWADTGDPVVP
jgi:hypothetical protein